MDYNITAGTHGRGIWRSDLQAEALAPNDIQLVAVENLRKLGCLRQKLSTNKTIINAENCPNSTPTLKPSSPTIKELVGKSNSLRAPAKPSP